MWLDINVKEKFHHEYEEDDRFLPPPGFAALTLTRWLGAVVVTVVLLNGTRSLAVTSFSRQTGLPCSTCHYTWPELTPFGRMFKLNGYTLTGMKQVTVKPVASHKTESALQLLEALPISVNVRLSDTATNRPQPGTQNGNIEFPQQLNVYFASAISAHAGAMMQVTYTPSSATLSFDNSDFRYANNGKLGGKDLVYGVNFDNNPTQEDLWNDTFQWGYPWYPPDSAPSPMASPIVYGALAGDVGGLGAYAMWDNHLYGDLTLYRSMHVGSPQPPTGQGYAYNIHGAAPYWRFAWQQNVAKGYLEVGTFGMHVSSTPGTIIGPTDTYTDAGVDAQFEHPVREHDELTLHTSFVHETSDLNATFGTGGSALIPHHLNTFKVDGIYHFGSKYAAGFGGFNTSGTTDPVLFAPGAVNGSATGSPDSDGYVAQFTYYPVQNVMLEAQYTGYFKFNGAGTNYDAAGRNASDNNAVYGLVFFTF